MLDRKIARIKKETNAAIEERDRSNSSPIEPAVSSLKEFMKEVERVEQRGNHQLHYDY